MEGRGWETRSAVCHGIVDSLEEDTGVRIRSLMDMWFHRVQSDEVIVAGCLFV